MPLQATIFGPTEIGLLLLVVLLIFGARRIPEIADVVAIVADCGGLEYARRKGEEFAQEAEEALSGIPDSEARQSLADAIGYVMDRRS